MFGAIGDFVSLMNAGGSVMWVLFVLNLALWYGLGYRYLTLRRGTEGNVRRLVAKHEKRGETQVMRGLLDYAAADALDSSKRGQSLGISSRDFVMDAISPYMMMIGTYSTLVKTIVVLGAIGWITWVRS